MFAVNWKMKAWYLVISVSLFVVLNSDHAFSASKFAEKIKEQKLAQPAQDEMPSMQKGQSQDESPQDMVYVCPMHPDETSDTPGSCKQCGMFLVARQMQDSAMDHSHHMHESSNGHVEPMDGQGMQHDAMPMPMSMPTAQKPALFWESSEPRKPEDKQHTHTDSAMHDHAQGKRMQPSLPEISSSAKPAMQGEHDSQQQALYICPMHPQIVQDHPGNCPICGMDLVTRENSKSDEAHPQVFLSAAVIQNMGVRSTRVRREMLQKQVRTQGLVTPDDDRILTVHPRTDGWIEVLHLITEGDRVERKEVLVDFYSPWINQVQLDYITALEEYDLTSFDPSRKTELSAKVDSLQNSLRMLNVMDMDIMRIKNSRKVQNTIQLRAPQGGIVTRLNVSEGTYVEPYQSMFTIVDLSQVWVMVDIYEHQAPWVRKGHKVDITAPAIPGRNWQGVVDFIYPEVDIKTRTLRARIAVANPDEALLLNMFVQVNISNTGNHQLLSVPREAVIITGERETVIRSLGNGHFQPVEVKTGLRDENRIEILSGLSEGDEIVVSGQFLIDSESNLQASFLRLTE